VRGGALGLVDKEEAVTHGKQSTGERAFCRAHSVSPG
jgi:hypothetical protein